MSSYQDFISTKQFILNDCGVEPRPAEFLFDFQNDVVSWALRRGRAALFLDTGLGKTACQLAWADQIADRGDVLILAPLCVTDQTVREGKRFGIECRYARGQDEASRITITNYEMLKNFDPGSFIGVVLDESSILKGMNGKYRQFITEAFRETPYRLSCTATPSPNDYMELGTQAEFLGIMSQLEMLAMFFIHDGSDTQKWRLKGHAGGKFWEWMSTWSVYLKSPADIGRDGSMYNLPPLNQTAHIIETGIKDGLFAPIAQSLNERNAARRDTVMDRCRKAAQIANGTDDQVLVWCHLNAESDALNSLIPDAVAVSGSDDADVKRDRLMGFTDGRYRVLITKPSIAGFGMNWQHCNQMVFVGLSDSWEQYYQAIRRCWRFGQSRPVDVHVISADVEGAVLENIRRKEKQNQEFSSSMAEHMAKFTRAAIQGARTEKTNYLPVERMEFPAWM